MNLETGRYFEQNHRRLDSLPGAEAEWAVALEKARRHVELRIGRRTLFGAHSEHRLGEEGVQYYLSYAYESILSGRWEWKTKNSLAEQMILIVDSTISKEVEKLSTAKAAEMPETVSYDDLTTRIFSQDQPEEEPSAMEQLVLDHKIRHIEATISGDEDLELYWEGIKEGMTAAVLAVSMNKTPEQIYKLRDRFINKIKHSTYFEF